MINVREHFGVSSSPSVTARNRSLYRAVQYMGCMAGISRMQDLLQVVAQKFTSTILP